MSNTRLAVDAPLTGVVTRDKWRENWLQKFCSRKGRSDSSLVAASNKLADNEFSFIRQSDFLLQNLLKLDDDGHLTIHGLLSYEYPLSHVEEFLRLLIELNEKQSLFQPDDLPVWGDDCRVMDRLSVASVDFENFVECYDSVYSVDSRVMNQNLVITLALLHGEQVVIEVLQRWTLSGPPGDVPGFISVVENWHDFREYPLDWTISMLRGE